MIRVNRFIRDENQYNKYFKALDHILDGLIAPTSFRDLENDKILKMDAFRRNGYNPLVEYIEENATALVDIPKNICFFIFKNAQFTAMNHLFLFISYNSDILKFYRADILRLRNPEAVIKMIFDIYANKEIDSYNHLVISRLLISYIFSTPVPENTCEMIERYNNPSIVLTCG